MHGAQNCVSAYGGCECLVSEGFASPASAILVNHVDPARDAYIRLPNASKGVFLQIFLHSALTVPATPVLAWSIRFELFLSRWPRKRTTVCCYSESPLELG